MVAAPLGRLHIGSGDIHTYYRVLKFFHFEILSGNSSCIFPGMICAICNRDSDDYTHRLCRAHSFCSLAGGSQYLANPCLVCQELFERAEDLDDPDDAHQAYLGLYKWILGFRKNSRNRNKGQDHFADQNERSRFEAIHARHSSVNPRGRDLSTPPLLQVSYETAPNFAFTILSIFWYHSVSCILISFLFFVTEI